MSIKKSILLVIALASFTMAGTAVKPVVKAAPVTATPVATSIDTTKKIDTVAAVVPVVNIADTTKKLDTSKVVPAVVTPAVVTPAVVTPSVDTTKHKDSVAAVVATPVVVADTTAKTADTTEVLQAKTPAPVPQTQPAPAVKPAPKQPAPEPSFKAAVGDGGNESVIENPWEFVIVTAAFFATVLVIMFTGDK